MVARRALPLRHCGDGPTAKKRRGRFTMACLAALMIPVLAQAQSDPTAGSAAPPAVEAMPLGAPNPAAAGLLSADVTGLPQTLWSASDQERLATLTAALRPPVPALRSLMRTLMLAEANPPSTSTTAEAHLISRLDWLVKAGHVEEALALMEIAGHDRPGTFRRWADLNLLLGNTAQPCSVLRNQPRLSNDPALRVFCTARSGDWSRAALLLQTARTLGDVGDRKADLLERFLDSGVNDERPPLLPPVRPTPLEFRLFEALGEPLPTAPLPLAYSVLDLPGDNGWKAQIEAAERLARAGALPANRLLGLYTLRKPAASGGVWDRAKALQAFETALRRGTPDAIGPALVRLWPQMASARLLEPFASLYAEALAEHGLKARPARLARMMIFLSAGYETLSVGLDEGASAETKFLLSIARGLTPQDLPTDLPHAGAVATAFAGAAPPQVIQEQLAQGRLGESILRAIALIGSGANGNAADLTDGLAVLRSVGLEDVARRTALQLMILDAERAR